MGFDYDGGWAEYVVTKAELVAKIPDALAFEQAATTFPVDVIAAHGVETASGMIAACSKANASGIFATSSALVTTYSAQPPS